MTQCVRALVVQAWGSEFKCPTSTYKPGMAVQACSLSTGEKRHELAGLSDKTTLCCEPQVQWETLSQRNKAKMEEEDSHHSSSFSGLCVHIHRYTCTQTGRRKHPSFNHLCWAPMQEGIKRWTITSQKFTVLAYFLPLRIHRETERNIDKPGQGDFKTPSFICTAISEQSHHWISNIKH